MNQTIDYRNVGSVYVTNTPFFYFDPRTGETVYLEKDYPSDGATYAFDIGARSDKKNRKRTAGWFVHDKLCDVGKFLSGKLVTNLQASLILYDIIKKDGYWFRAPFWFLTTFLFGGGQARKNGMFRLKKGLKNG